MTDSLFSSSDGLDPEVVEAAREELRRRLPELRDLPGFPIGSDEDILKMSVPPYYTACPNPFIERWLEETKPDGYDDRDYLDPGPFASDISEGKKAPEYLAHVYWTKVPHKAIMRYILHYTRPGDVVLDGFSGTGMTAVAAQACGNPDTTTRVTLDTEMNDPEWGARRAVIQDLSPIATFISAGLNLPVDAQAFDEASQRILDEFDEEWGWMYETAHTDGSKVKIDYTVWSEIFTCPSCSSEIVFMQQAFDEKTNKLRDSFPCGDCGTDLTSGSLVSRTESYFDHELGETVERPVRRPVEILYRVGRTKYRKLLSEDDFDTLRRCETVDAPAGLPTDRIPYMHMTHERNDLAASGITRFHQFWHPRARIALAYLWDAASSHADPALRAALLFWVEQLGWGLSWMNRFSPSSFSQVNRYRKGVYYVGSLITECSPWYNLVGSSPARGKRAALIKLWASHGSGWDHSLISTASSERLLLPDSSVDYVFADPPFGENIYYADLDYLLETLHGVRTEDKAEAIVNRNKNEPRTLEVYEKLMTGCFKEFYRVLRPGRWMTVEFSNSRNSVWLAIQDALASSGFVVADTRVLDKGMLTERQKSAKNAVNRDIIISAYRPSAEVEGEFARAAGSIDGAWTFVREHLTHVAAGEGLGARERRADVLWDRMCAFHVQRGVSIPLSAPEFYEGLEKRFPVRDGMYFLPEQLEAYERSRMTFKELAQAELFITNEHSAIQWLRQFLKPRPRAFTDISVAFKRELQTGLPDWEELPDLIELLSGSFIQDDSGRWYVPNPKRSADLEKLRIASLLREFESYATGTGKLQQFRSEAIRAGFQAAWGRRDFSTIVKVGRRLPDDVRLEDEALLMYYDNARRHAGDS